MNQLNKISANSFHVGSICPYCQHQIDLKQTIILCENCRSWQHDNCWDLNQGCGSYHCDDKSRAAVMDQKPEFVITNDEANSVKHVPIPVRRTTREVAEENKPPLPEKLSKLALISCGLALINLSSFYAMFTGDMNWIVTGCITSFFSIILGVIAIMIINSKKRHGNWYAMSGIFISAVLVVFSTARIYVILKTKRTGNHTMKANFNIQENSPSEEELLLLKPERANALRANVVIKCNTNDYFNATLGSGIVIKKDGNNAFLLTNKHVIVNAEDIEITFYNGESSKGTVVWQASNNIDIAIVSCPLLVANKIVPIKLLPDFVPQSRQVFAVGNPMNLLWSYTEGVISSRRIQSFGDTEISIYQTQTPINQGNSGGGLYNKVGVLIGVNTWTQNKAFSEGLNFAITSKSIISLLKASNNLDFIQISKSRIPK